MREAKADIEMDTGQEEEEEEEVEDPGPFCRKSAIRRIVVTLRLDRFHSGKPPCQIKAR